VRIEIVQVPYDSGHRGARMGAGPEHFIQNGLARALTDDGHEVCTEVVEAREPFRSEIATAFELHRLLAERVSPAKQRGSFPLVLSGNCNSCIGAISGVRSGDLGVVWFDGHADFHTPETSAIGFLDGMGLAIAVGDCWETMAQSIPGFSPVPEENVVVVGVRGIVPVEWERLQRSGVSVVGAELVRREGAHEALRGCLDALRSRTQDVHVHLDVDVLDPAYAAANGFARPDGLSVEEVETGVQMIRERFTIASASIASYDPAYDGKGRVLRAGTTFARALTASSGATEGPC
jgi:arginase